MVADDWADDWLPRRPRLRPGLRVIRRDGRHLQVGLDPAAGWSSRTASRPGGCSPISGPGADPHWTIQASAAGAGSSWSAALSWTPMPSTRPCAGRSRAKPSCRPSPPPGPPPPRGSRPAARPEWRSMPTGPWRDRHAAGDGRGRADRRRRPAPAGSRTSSSIPPTSSWTSWSRASEPHLVVTRGGRPASPSARSSSPGLTACLRCVDAHRVRPRPAPRRGPGAARRVPDESGPVPTRSCSSWRWPGRCATWSPTSRATSRRPGRRRSRCDPAAHDSPGSGGCGTRAAAALGRRARRR